MFDLKESFDSAVQERVREVEGEAQKKLHQQEQHDITRESLQKKLHVHQPEQYYRPRSAVDILFLTLSIFYAS